MSDDKIDFLFIGHRILTAYYGFAKGRISRRWNMYMANSFHSNLILILRVKKSSSCRGTSALIKLTVNL